MVFPCDLLLLMTYDASLEKDAGKPCVEEDEDAIVYMKGKAFVALHEGLRAIFILLQEGLDKTFGITFHFP